MIPLYKSLFLVCIHTFCKGEDANGINPDCFIDEKGYLYPPLGDIRSGACLLHCRNYVSCLLIVFRKVTIPLHFS